MKKIILISGLTCLVLVLLTMLQVIKTVITTDKQFFMMLFGGILLSMFGFYLNERDNKPFTRYGIEKRRKLMRYCIYAVAGCIIMLVMVMFM